MGRVPNPFRASRSALLGDAIPSRTPQVTTAQAGREYDCQQLVVGDLGGSRGARATLRAESSPLLGIVEGPGADGDRQRCGSSDVSHGRAFSAFLVGASSPLIQDLAPKSGVTRSRTCTTARSTREAACSASCSAASLAGEIVNQSARTVQG